MIIELDKNKNEIIGSIYTPYKYKVFNKCPICMNKNIKRKGRNGTGDTKAHPQVFRCNNCGVFFVNPIIDLDSVYQLYEKFDVSYGTLSNESIKKIKRNVNHWNNYFVNSLNRKNELKFLEIGSATGELVKTFSQVGWEAHGIEPCKALVDYSTKDKDLINIQHSTAEEADYPDNYFDLIHFWHVLEHVIEPMKILNNIYRWLKPGGILNLGTPSPDNLVTKIYPNITGFFDLWSMHTFIFPQKTLKFVLTSIGFEINIHEVYSTPKSGSSMKIKMRNVLHHIYPRAVSYYQKLEARKPTEPNS